MNFHTMIVKFFNHFGQLHQKPVASSQARGWSGLEVISSQMGMVMRVHLRNSVFTVMLAVGLLMVNTVSLCAVTVNGALQFDGTNQYVDAGNSTNLQIMGNLTIEAWIKPFSSGVPVVYTIVSKQDGSFCFNPCYVFYINDRIGAVDQTIRFDSEGISSRTTTGVITWDAWQHVAVVVSGNTAGTIYLNGVPQTTTGSVNLANADMSSNLRIGIMNDDSRPFLGLIDEVRIWNIARTPAEIQNNKDVVLSGTEPGLVAYYRFDEGSGTIAYDLAGSDNSGTLMNNPTWTTPGAPVTQPIIQANQTITFGTLPAKTYGDAPFTLTATASSGLPVTYTATGNCTVSGNTVTLTSAGTCGITASQAGDSNYLPAPDVTQTLTINSSSSSQTITFGPLPTKTYGDSPFELTATASSGLTVTFTATGNCTVSGKTVTLTSAGTCDITAHQAGDSNYSPAPDVIQTLTINSSSSSQTISFDSLPTKTYGDPPFELTATASSGLTVTYTATGNCSVSRNTVTLTHAGTCDITAHQAGNSDYSPAPEVTQILTISPPFIPQPGPAWIADLTPYQETGLGVRVELDGTGQGRVVSSPDGLDCSPDHPDLCLFNFKPTTIVILTPIPADGSKFSGWGGNEDCRDGSLFLNSGILCIAYFQSLNHPLTVEIKGRGKVSTDNFKCPPTCQSDYLDGTTVTLQTRPRPSWTFAGWSGDCDSQGRVTLTAAKTCQANFIDDPNIPNDRDGNDDGLKDAYQDNVVSIPDKLTNQYVTTEVEKNCIIDTMSSEMLDQVAAADPAYQFYQGLLYFDIVCAATKVTFYYHSIDKITRHFVMQKYGPKVPGDLSTLGWYIIPDAVFDTVKVGKQTVMRASYSLTDGELGDNTGVDGHIIDPVGVSWVK